MTVAFTNRRIYRKAYVLVGFQSAEHTPVSDFSAARSMFCEEAMIDSKSAKDYSMGGETTPFKNDGGRFLPYIKPDATLRGMATPKSLETVLRSCLGTWASIGGGQYQLTLTRGLSEFATLGLVESKDAGSPQNFVREWDAWAKRVSIRLGSDLHAPVVESEWIGRDYDRTPLNALGGISLPSDFAPPGMEDTFAPHDVRLYRDPAGANVQIACEELEIVFDQGFSHEHWNDTKPLVKKVGYTSVTIRLRGSVSDETYAIISDAESTTFKRFKATFTTKSGKVFSVDLSNVDFAVAPIGWTGGRFLFEAEGEAYMNGSDYLTVINTP